MKVIKVRRPNGSLRVSHEIEGRSRTQQHSVDECDVNKIIAKYKTTGVFTHLSSRQGVYADVSQVGDYKESLDKVIRANDLFASLPARLRARFNNNPAELLKFVADKNNYNEAVELGLIDKKIESAFQPAVNDNKQNDDKKAGSQADVKTVKKTNPPASGKTDTE